MCFASFSSCCALGFFLTPRNTLFHALSTLGKEVMFLVTLVSLFDCSFVGLRDSLESYEQIFMIFLNIILCFILGPRNTPFILIVLLGTYIPLYILLYILLHSYVMINSTSFLYYAIFCFILIL